MAVVKAPALSLDASGNLGGICYSKWRGLSIARSVWTGTDPNTVKQQAQRALMTAVSQAWSGVLTASERESWSKAASEQVRMSRVKTTYVPTGYQYFCETNLIIQKIPFPIITTPVAFKQEDGFFDMGVFWEPFLQHVVIQLLDVVDGTNDKYYTEIYRAGPYINGGRHALAGEYRALDLWSKIIDGIDATATAGNYYWYKVRWLWRLGVVGNWFERQVYTG